jgi:hypothetical protein
MLIFYFASSMACVLLAGLFASADSAPRISFGFGIWNTFHRSIVAIFRGFLFFLLDFLLFGALSAVSTTAWASHASHASRIPPFLCNS